jgi:PEGA domain
MSTGRTLPRTTATLAAGSLAAIMPWAMLGCLERTIQVASSPPGAEVFINDVYVGRTPAATGFEYYGTYDVRLRKEGHEPITTHRSVSMPVWEIPPIDLAASALPLTFRARESWHFDLMPSEDLGNAANQEALIERARALRRTIEPPR